MYQIHGVYLFGIASIAFVMTNAKISLLGASQTLLLLFKIKEVTKSKMTNRARKNGLYFGLTDEEKLILDTKKREQVLITLLSLSGALYAIVMRTN